MTQEKFEQLVTADIMRNAGASEETIAKFLNGTLPSQLAQKKVYWTGSPEINPFKDDEEDWNNDNDRDDEPKSDYERNYEDNRARQYE